MNGHMLQLLKQDHIINQVMLWINSKKLINYIDNILKKISKKKKKFIQKWWTPMLSRRIKLNHKNKKNKKNNKIKMIKINKKLKKIFICLKWSYYLHLYYHLFILVIIKEKMF